MRFRWKRSPRRTVSANHVKVISVEQMRAVVAELKRVEHGTPEEQAQVVAWASDYADCYFRTATGSLRRVFPQGKLLAARKG